MGHKRRYTEDRTEDPLMRIRVPGMLEDGGIVLTCYQCGRQFVLTKGERESYEQQGPYLPNCCPQCCLAPNNEPRCLVCSDCGAELNEAIYCEACFRRRYIDFEEKVKDCQRRTDEVQSKLWIIESRLRELQNYFTTGST